MTQGGPGGDGAAEKDPARDGVYRVAIIGGGPSGLMAARHLEALPSERIHVTLFEKSERLGGKVLTASFASAPVSFEAGADAPFSAIQTAFGMAQTSGGFPRT